MAPSSIRAFILLLIYNLTSHLITLRIESLHYYRIHVNGHMIAVSSNQQVWGCVLASLFVIGFLIYILDRLSPYSSYGKGGPDCEEAEDFNLLNSLWFAFASCLQQGDFHIQSHVADA